VVLVAPLLLAAADPAGDAIPCPHLPEGSHAGPVPDLVAARGEIVELGTSVRFTLRFAEPLEVPDPSGHPLRVEVVLLDPEVPPVDAGLYRNVNRILRYDAVREPVTTTLLLAEAGQSRFLPPAVDDDTVTFQVPGRTLVADEDETGTSPGVEALRWGVIVRDEGSCDLLGAGQATRRLAIVEAADDVDRAPVPTADAVDHAGGSPWIWVGVAAATVVALAGLGWAVRRRPPRAG
jgi:hypothetical protein